MLTANNNRAIIRKLALRYLQAGRSRNISAVVAIALTAVLFTTVFTLGSGLMDTVRDQNIRRAGADGHAVLSFISDDVYDRVKGSALIDKIAYTKAISYRLRNPGLEKWRAEMWYMDDRALEFSRYQPVAGHRPVLEDEIMIDTKTLKALGVPAQLGQSVPLKYAIKGVEYERHFTLCGYWNTDSLANTGCLVVSQAFVAQNAELLAYTYPQDNDYSGVVNAYIMFRGGDPDRQLQQLLDQSGVAEDSVIARVSPAYQSGALAQSPALILSALAGLMLIMATGFLIIYNIFQISVIQDIQSYGQLKTLGTTRRQIVGLIGGQAALLSLVGIPIGLLLGFLIGRALVPALMNGTQFSPEAGVKVTANPLIFLGAALFAFATVYLSVRRPAAIAGSVSPIQAMRYTETGAAPRKQWVSGGKIHQMALANLGRNRKRTALSILSMALGLILLGTVYTLSSGFDIDKYVAKFVSADFVISTADYFRFRFEQSASDLSQSFIDAVKAQDGFADGGRLYAPRALEEGYSVDSQSFSNYNRDEAGHPLIDLYGADDFLLKSMEVVEGAIDWDKLKAGNFVLLGVETDDNGHILDYPGVSAGDTLTFHHILRDGLDSAVAGSFPLTVMAKVRVNANTHTTRTAGAARLYLPADAFLALCRRPHLASFPFDAQPGLEDQMESFLRAYTQDVEPGMDFDSRATYVRAFHGLTALILTLGGALSLITGLIGLVNFVNSMLTSIVTRRKEFAALRSIGMTKGQLKRMLTYEGLYYAAGTILLSLALGSLFSLVVLRAVAGGVWFFTYRFALWPMLISYPPLIALTAAIPAILFHGVARERIVDQLR